MSFFFVKQKTAYEMRISDGSSDVCSSDLPDAGPEQHTAMLAIYRGAIAVNRSGRRFADESVSYKLLGDACLRQEGHVAYQVFDEAIFQNQVRGVPIFDFSRRLDQGLLHRADTLEDLARRIDVPPDALAETVAAYNADVDQGEDGPLGRRGRGQGFGGLRTTAPARKS